MAFALLAFIPRTTCFNPIITRAHGRDLFSSKLYSSTSDISEVKIQRIDPQEIAYDSRYVAQNGDSVKAHLLARRAGEEQLEAVDKIGVLMEKRLALIKTKDGALSIRKSVSAEIGKLMKAGEKDSAEEKKKEVEVANQQADAAEAELNEVDAEVNTLFAGLPNLLDPRTVDGDDDTQNEVVSEWGTEGGLKKGEQYLWHDDIALGVGGWDPDASSAISGARFSVLRGPLARLERAIGQFFLDEHTQKNGYEEVSVPYVVTRSTLEGTGQLPKFEEDLFKVNHVAAGEDAFLIPTAEVPLTSLLRGKVLDPKILPISLTGLTPCFRAEAGSYGQDTRGLLRQHQFHKVELVKICTPEQSFDAHEELTAHAEACLQALKLPYRKVRLCSGDIGFGARMCYDLEVWLPGQEMFREIASCSNCADFQARRMGLRYRVVEGKKKKTVFCHTMNGSGLAVGRTLVAILENYYNPEDGSVAVPEVLQPYMGGQKKIEKVTT
eukprot:CAMPEP_0113942684 /NCGR_PEP_ID=MMETSP1339-20121228/8335_1 /TAXON_ID=94617 /ORGANISM="Fibrocapsa japonica" /LENGTH=494 /DNA_ID=CAMNT_0000947225 /DNA_START=18 /DNA_END=1502 /DNA_ORIENTATION=+ /assembly_acc=CAM_ASM_000762